MFEERDSKGPAWGWLRGFAYFLLAWPLLSLLALNKLDFKDWESIVIAVFGPAAIGLVLLGIEWLMTRLFARRIRSAAVPVPNLWRDLSNTGIAMALLLVIDVMLVTAFESEPIIASADAPAARTAVLLLGVACGSAMLLRAVGRLLRGKARVVDLGEGWDRAPATTRFLGYLTLIPVLLVCTVMIDYELRQRDGFGTVAWVVLPLLLWLGLRSAMARSPRWWARNPWEAWLRRASLSLPWWIVAVAAALGFVALCILMPLGVLDDTTTRRERIIGAFILGPLGFIVLFATAAMLRRGIPETIGQWLAARRLANGQDEVSEWSVGKTAGQVRLLVHRRGEVTFEMAELAGPTIAWLAARRR